MSPAIHETPAEGEDFIAVSDANTLTDTIVYIQNQRPNWEWSSALAIRRALYQHGPLRPRSFYQYDQASGQHLFATLALEKMGDSIRVNATQYKLPTLKPFD